MKTIADKDIKFLLKDNRATGPTLIYLIYRYQNTRFKYSTSQTIEPYLWDVENNCAITDPKKVNAKRERERHETLNANLSRHRNALKAALAQLNLANVEVNNSIIKLQLEKELGKPEKVKKTTNNPQPTRETFTAYIDRFVREADNCKRLNAKSTKYALNTLKGYSKLKRVLEAYRAETKRPIDFDDITMEFYHKFNQWLTAKQYAYNYIGSLFKDIKILLRQAHKEGLHTNLIFNDKEFRKFSQEVDAIYLSNQELQTLYDLNLSDTPGLANARDLFLIGAYTGLRFSDFSKIRPENISEDGRVLSIRTSKTAEKIDAPLNAKVRAILNRNNNQLRTITNQRLNDHLKELGRRAGITEMAEVTTTKGGIRETIYYEKWKLMCTHTARRSFSTNAYLAKVDIPAIMKITGHRTEKMFLKYIRVDSMQNARLLLQHEHFL